MNLKNLFNPGESSFPKNGEGCCGLHEVCEKAHLFKSNPHAIEYYDDEELDIFKGYSPHAYSVEEVEQFREILHTMWKSDISGWLRSLQSRGIAFPEALKNDVLYIFNI
jgi:hypothetical protein